MLLDIEVILFDLGGVLIDTESGLLRMLEWTNWSINKDQFWEKWLTSTPVRQFETGKINAEEFAEAFVRDFNLSVSAKQFIDEYTYFLKGPYSGAVELIQKLTKEYVTASFSNSNELHWERICNEMDLVEHMDFNFPSHQIGLLKPDKDAFAYVIDKLNCNPEKILYFDDNQINIDAANSMKIHSCKVFGIEELKNRLKDLIGWV